MYHLHCHTVHSPLDGIATVENYIDGCIANGIKGFAITDHGSISAMVDIPVEKKGIKVISGCEFYLCKSIDVKTKKSYHLTVLAQTFEGWRNICRMSTIAWNEGFYYKPRITFEILKRHSKGIVILTGCLKSPLNIKMNDNEIDSNQVLNTHLVELSRNYGVPIFLEFMPHYLNEQYRFNQALMNVSHLFPIVATNDAHYVDKDDYIAQDVALCIIRKMKFNDQNRFRMGVDKLHLKTEIEMANGFFKMGFNENSIRTMINNTDLIGDNIEFSYTDLKTNKFFLPGSGIKWEEMIQIAYKRILDVVADKDEQTVLNYIERLHEECKIIDELGFKEYIATVYKIIKSFKEAGILIGDGRGSVTGSLLCFGLGITNVDPIEHKTLFFRFINPHRVSLPDIDIDGCSHGLGKEILSRMYNIALIQNNVYMKGQNIINDFARVMGIPIDRFENVKSLIEEHGFKDGVNLSSLKPETKKILLALHGNIRATSIHAGGIVITENPIHELGVGHYCRPKGKNLHRSINLTKECESYGIIKIDYLKVTILKVIRETIEKIKKTNPAFQIVKDDPETYEFLKTSDNLTGLFQVTGYSTRAIVSSMKVDCISFQLLTQLIAVSRPGPKNTILADYIDAVNKNRPIKNPFPGILNETYGFVIFQEQIMMLLGEVGFTKAESDSIRRLIAKKRDKEGFEKYENLFCEKALPYFDNNFKDTLEFWKAIVKHSEYSFSKNHAVGYGMTVYQTAFLKMHYHDVYCSMYLTYMGETRQALLSSLVDKGYECVPPMRDKTDIREWIIEGKKIYAPFTMIKGIKEKTARLLISKNSIDKNGHFDIDGKKAGKKRELWKKYCIDRSDENIYLESSLFELDLKLERTVPFEKLNINLTNLTGITGVRTDYSKIIHLDKKIPFNWNTKISGCYYCSNCHKTAYPYGRSSQNVSCCCFENTFPFMIITKNPKKISKKILSLNPIVYHFGCCGETTPQCFIELRNTIRSIKPLLTVFVTKHFFCDELKEYMWSSKYGEVSQSAKWIENLNTFVYFLMGRWAKGGESYQKMYDKSILGFRKTLKNINLS